MLPWLPAAWGGAWLPVPSASPQLEDGDLAEGEEAGSGGGSAAAADALAAEAARAEAAAGIAIGNAGPFAEVRGCLLRLCQLLGCRAAGWVVLTGWGGLLQHLPKPQP